MKRLTIIVDGIPMVQDLEVTEIDLTIVNELEEIRSNPAMFAVLAGAPFEVWKDLPGESVEYTSFGRPATITVRL